MMETLSHYLLKRLRVAYKHVYPEHLVQMLPCSQDPNLASQDIYQLLTTNAPCMIARYGSVELTCIFNYLAVLNTQHDLLKYLRHESSQWWWDLKAIKAMRTNAGFFSNSLDLINRFCELMLEDTKYLDLLGSWLKEEQFMGTRIKEIPRHGLLCIEPYWAKDPWTMALQGKKVLIIHPFASTIEQQYKHHRMHLFENPNVLPSFHLQTLKAVQSIGGNTNGFKDWFDALHWMEKETDSLDFDIALIGCGAYGFPLAAHIKRSGRKAIHLGGALQLLFGIRGNRWDNPDYNQRFNYQTLFNDYWVRPTAEERPEKAEDVEGATYW